MSIKKNRELMNEQIKRLRGELKESVNEKYDGPMTIKVPADEKLKIGSIIRAEDEQGKSILAKVVKYSGKGKRGTNHYIVEPVKGAAKTWKQLYGESVNEAKLNESSDEALTDKEQEMVRKALERATGVRVDSETTQTRYDAGTSDFLFAGGDEMMLYIGFGDDDGYYVSIDTYDDQIAFESTTDFKSALKAAVKMAKKHKKRLTTEYKSVNESTMDDAIELLKEFKSQAYFNGNMKIGQVYSNPYARSFVNEKGEEIQRESGLNLEQKQAFLEAVKSYKRYSESIYRNRDLKEVYQSIKNVVEVAQKMTIDETQDWFDGVTVGRHMKRMNESFKVFEKTLKEVSTLQQRLESAYDEIGEVLGKYYEINELEEGNEFGAARAKAIASGEDSFEVDGKTYKVTGVDKEDKENAKKFVGESTNESTKLTDILKKKVKSVNEAVSSSKIKASLDKKIDWANIADDEIKLYPNPIRIEPDKFDAQLKKYSKAFKNPLIYLYGTTANKYNTTALFAVVSRLKSTTKIIFMSDKYAKAYGKGSLKDSDIKGVLKMNSLIASNAELKESVNEGWDVKDGNFRFVSKDGSVTVSYKGKKIAGGDFDRGADAYFVYSDKKSIAKILDTGISLVPRGGSFDDKEEVLKYYKKLFRESVNESNELKKLEDAIKMFQDKIKKQGMVTNARDEEHLARLKKMYNKMGGKLESTNESTKLTDLLKIKVESVNEAKDTYFDSATEAVNYARKMIEKRGFEIDEDDWQSQIGLGGRHGRIRPGTEKNTDATIGLLKNGKPQRKALQISLYGMPSGKYELTYYVN